MFIREALHKNGKNKNEKRKSSIDKPETQEEWYINKTTTDDNKHAISKKDCAAKMQRAYQATIWASSPDSSPDRFDKGVFI